KNMQLLRRLFNPRWWRFEWRYLRRNTPWDTRITPPEVMEFINETQPGRALDLGCGTGTNAVTLTQHGWQVTGVDFSPQAIAAARRKAIRKSMKIKFHVGDVSDLRFLDGLFDYGLDIGCLHTLSPVHQKPYASEVARLLRSGAAYMLYAWLPQKRGNSEMGLSPQAVEDLFKANFILKKQVRGKDGPGESAWYWLRRV
ncbi:MAG: class I SAM-dependent methyltransferase, partial [Desulfobacteraceae bacterium]